MIILGFLVVTGRSRLQRGETLARLPLPGDGRVSLLSLAVGIVVGAGLLVGVDSWADALITTFALAIILASVVVIAGYAGQLSLCQFTLAGIGGVDGGPAHLGERLAVRARLVGGDRGRRSSGSSWRCRRSARVGRASPWPPSRWPS